MNAISPTIENIKSVTQAPTTPVALVTGCPTPLCVQPGSSTLNVKSAPNNKTPSANNKKNADSFKSLITFKLASEGGVVF